MALFKARFDERLDCWLSRRPWGKEGRAADRASHMLEPPLGGGSGERHVQTMPEPGRRDPLTSAYSERASIYNANYFVSHDQGLSKAWLKSPGLVNIKAIGIKAQGCAT